MLHMAFRVIFLLGIMAYAAEQWLGYTLRRTIEAVYDLSAEQLEALMAGVTALGLGQVMLLLVGVFYRRGVRLAFKKAATVLVALLPKRWRYQIRSWFSFPKEYTGYAWGRLNHWYDHRLGVFLANWVRALKYSIAVFVLVFGSIELLLALIRGATLLPPVILRFKGEILAGIGAFVLGTIIQTVLLLLARGLYWIAPKFLQRKLRHGKRRTLRVLVVIRYRYVVRRYSKVPVRAED